MKIRSLLLVSVACAGLSLMASSGLANGTMGNDYSLEIINNSSHTVYSLYATNRDDRNWGDDILPVALDPGESYTVDVDDFSGYCMYDLKASTYDGDVTWRRDDYNVCEEYEWVLIDGRRK